MNFFVQATGAIAASCALSIASLGAAQAQPKANAAVYGALPSVVEMQISPDGNTAAALQNVGNQSAIVFYDLNNPNAEPTGALVGGSDARTIEWVDNDRILVLISQSDTVDTVDGLTTIEFFRWVALSKSKLNSSRLFRNQGGYYINSAGELLSVLPDNPKKVLLARISPGGQTQRQAVSSRFRSKPGFGYSLFRVDLGNGVARRAETGNENTRDWIVDASGEPVLRIDYDRPAQKREVYLKRDGKSGYTMIRDFNERPGRGSRLIFYGLAATGDTVLATISGDGGRRSLVEFNLETGDVGQTVFNNPAYDISNVVYNPRTATVTGVRFIDDLPRAYHLNPEDRKVQTSLLNTLPGAAPIITSKSANGNRMIVEAIYIDHPKQFFLFDKERQRLEFIASNYDKLDGVTYAQKEKFDYTSSDGLLIRGYLTIPKGAPKKAMPLIVLPHGGPATRADQSFDYWSFFYAARGYLVYEPNFRGSRGYGASFRVAGYGEWGRKMQDDISEGVKKLVADGVVDPQRICIVGASYGGYAALAGATLTPDLYACAVSVNGVSNLQAMLGDAAKDGPLSEDYWEVRLGGNRFRPAELNAVSPSENAHRAGAPILLIHAKDDDVVPISQSLRMRNALLAAGKPHEYIALDGEDHWLSTGEMRTEMLRRSIDFIDKHIGQ